MDGMRKTQIPGEQEFRPAAGSVSNDQIVGHLPLVKAIAAKLYRSRWGDAVAFDEYCQMGAVGLVDAASRFDQTIGVPFGAFASWRITGAILDGLERSTEQHQQIAVRKRLLADRTRSVTEDSLPWPGLKSEPIEAVLTRIASVAVGLAVGFMLEDSGMYAGEEQASPFDGSSRLVLLQLSSQLRQAVLELPLQEKSVLEGHYFQHISFVDLATRLGVTKGRISQIHRRGIERLRLQLTSLDFADFRA